MRTLILLACLLFVLPASGQLSDAQTMQQVPVCLTTSNQAVTNLVACGVKFTGDGQIRFGVKNLGTVPFNRPSVTLTSGSAARATSTQAPPPVQVDVYMQNSRVASAYVKSLGANELTWINVPIPSNYSKPKCAESRELKAVVDSTKMLAESSEGDNVIAKTNARPCPDMAIESINKNWNNLKTEFVARIKIVNKGNAPAKFRYMALTSNSSSFGPLPSADFDKWMEIEAGGSKTFNIGNAFATSSMYVRVFLDRWYEVDELDENNNFKEETLNN